MTLHSGAAGTSTVSPSRAVVPRQPGERTSLPVGSPPSIPDSEQVSIWNDNVPLGPAHEAFGVPPVKFTVTSTNPTGTSSTVPRSTGPSVPAGTSGAWVTFVT